MSYQEHQSDYNMTYKEIAAELGVSRQTVAYVEKQALEKLRILLEQSKWVDKGETV